MGCYDTLSLYGKCPACKREHYLDIQTKDLMCSMYDYVALPEDWFNDKLGQKFRKKMPVFPRYPLDKSSTVWKNQAERTEAMATIPTKEFKDEPLKCLRGLYSCFWKGKKFYDCEVPILKKGRNYFIINSVKWVKKK